MSSKWMAEETAQRCQQLSLSGAWLGRADGTRQPVYARWVCGPSPPLPKPTAQSSPPPGSFKDVVKSSSKTSLPRCVRRRPETIQHLWRATGYP